MGITTETVRTEAINALRDECFPCNPRPFAAELGKLVAENGTDSIKSDEAKALLWILMAQAYGQMARIDLCDEWDRLNKYLEAKEKAPCESA